MLEVLPLLVGVGVALLVLVGVLRLQQQVPRPLYGRAPCSPAQQQWQQ